MSDDWIAYREAHEALYWLREYADNAGDLTVPLSRASTCLDRLDPHKLPRYWYSTMEYALNECAYLRQTSIRDEGTYDQIVALERIASKVMIEMWFGQASGQYGSAAVEILLKRVSDCWHRLDDNSRRHLIGQLELCVPHFLSYDGRFLELLDDIMSSITIRRPLSKAPHSELNDQLADLILLWREIAFKHGRDPAVQCALSVRSVPLFREMVELNTIAANSTTFMKFADSLRGLDVPSIAQDGHSKWDGIRKRLAEVATCYQEYSETVSSSEKETLRSLRPALFPYLHGREQRPFRRLPEGLDMAVHCSTDETYISVEPINLDMRASPGIAFAYGSPLELYKGKQLTVALRFVIGTELHSLELNAEVARDPWFDDVTGANGAAITLNGAAVKADGGAVDDPASLQTWLSYVNLRSEIAK